MIFKWQEKYRELDMHVIAGCFALIILGLMVSWRVSVFTPLFALFILYFFITRKSFSIPFVLWPFAVISVFYFIGIVFSDQIYHQTSQGTLNIAIGFLFGFAIFNTARDIRDITRLIKRILKFIFFTVSFISILGVVKINLMFFGIRLPILMQEGLYPFGTNLTSNYNNIALACLVGMLAGVELIRHSSGKKLRKVYIILQVPILINLLCSGSRRSLVLFCLFILVALMALCYLILSKKEFRDKIFAKWKLIAFMGLMCITVSLGFWYFINRMKPEERIELVRISPYNERLFTKELTKIVFRYHTLLGEAASIEKFYHDFWGLRYYTLKKQVDSNKGRVIEDTYEDYETETTPGAYAGRMERYELGLRIFGDYNLAGKIFGEGFDYIDQYRTEFLLPHGINKEDYPHNFYLSALLYSGLLGLAVLLLFTLLFLYKLYLLFKVFPEFSAVVLTTFASILISYNSIFSLRLFVILMILTLVAELRLRNANESSSAGS